MSPVKYSTYILMLSLVISDLWFVPPVQPERIRKWLSTLSIVIALSFTYFNLALYPAIWHMGLMVASVGMVAIAIVPPIAGLLESKFAPNGQSIYSTGVLPGTTNRFPGHLLTNILGALVASAFLWLAHSTTGFNEFAARFPSTAAFNIILPLSTLVVLSFARWQQTQVCPDMDEAVKNPGWEARISGFSLRHWHQLTNVLYLIVVTFVVTTTFLYLVAHAMVQSKSGHPLTVSWQVILTILVSLSFFYACGGPWSRRFRAVHLTFLTGTPAALGAVLVWLSWFKHDATRNIALVSIVGIGYVLYCTEVVFANLAQDERLRLHYFSVVGIGVVIAVLLGALYMSL